MATLADLLTSKIPPQDTGVERALLGGILMEGDHAWARVCERLQEDDFYTSTHRRIWAAYRDLVADGIEIDFTTVRHALAPHAADLGGPVESYLAELSNEAAVLTNLASYAALIRRLSARRRLIQLATDVVQRAYEGDEDPVSISVRGGAAFTEIAALAQVAAPPSPTTLHRLDEIVDEVVHALESGSTPSLLPLPYGGLNHFLGGGLAGGELVLLGAWPGIGKSTLATEIARYAGRHGRSVLIMSREMKRQALARRIIAQEAEVDAMGLRRGHLEAGDMARLRLQLSAIRGLPIWITDNAPRIADIERFASTTPWLPKLGLVIVDYLQLVEAPEGAESHRLAIESVSSDLKRLAMTLEVPVICLSALSRAGEGNRGRRPTKADLRESGKLEHDADVILLLHRADPMQGETEVIIDKARDASVGIVKLQFHPATVRFTEVSDRVAGF